MCNCACIIFFPVILFCYFCVLQCVLCKVNAMFSYFVEYCVLVFLNIIYNLIEGWTVPAILSGSLAALAGLTAKQGKVFLCYS